VPFDKVGEADIEVGADGGKFLPELKAITDAAEKLLSKQGQKMGEALSKPLQRPASRMGRLFQVITVSLPFLVSGISSLAGATSALGGSLLNTVIAGASFIPVIAALGPALGAGIIGALGLKAAMSATGKELKKFPTDTQLMAKAVKGLQKDWIGLRNTISGALFKGLSDDVSRLGSTLFPALQGVLVTTAGILNKVTGQFLTFLNSAQGVGLVTGAMNGLNRIISIMSTTALPLFKGLLFLIVGLTPSGERLANALARGAKSLSDWAVGVAASGQLAAFMSKAQTTAGRLWDILKNVTKSLFNVFQASSGSGETLLAVLQRVTGKFAEFTASTAGKASIAAWAGKGVQALERIGQIVTTLAPMFAEMAKPELFNALLAVLQSTADAFKVMAPVVNSAVRAFSQLLTFVAPLLGPLIAAAVAFRSLLVIGKIITVVLRFTGLLKVLQILLFNIRIAFALAWAAGLGPIIIVIGVIALLVAAFVVLWKKSDAFRGFWIGIWNAIQSAAAAVGAWFTGTLLPWFQSVWDSITAGATALWTTISAAFSAVVTAVTGFVSMVVTAVVAFVAQVTSVMLTIVNVLTYPWRIAIALVIGIVLVFWNALYPIFAAGVATVVGYVTGLWSQIVGIFNAVRAFVIGVWNAIWAAVAPVVNAIVGGVSAGFHAVQSVVTTVMGAVRSFLSAAWAFIRNLVATATGAVRNTVSAGFRALVGLVSGPVNQVRSTVSNAFNAVVHAITGAVGAAGRAAASVGRAIYDGVSHIVGDMVGIGSNIVHGLINGITGMAGQLRSAVMGFIDRNVPGPVRKLLHLGSPSKLFEQFGKWTAQGLANGLVAQANSVAKSSGLLAKSTIKGFDATLGTNPAGMGTPPSLAAGGQTQTLVGSGGDTFEVSLNVSIDDLAKMSQLADFLDMLKDARVNARKTARSGTVAA
jgi:phage-related protein